MKKSSLVKPDHPILRVPARTVVTFDTSLTDLSHRMISAMADGNGVGIAAPQLGIRKRVIAVYVQGFAVVMVNPKITSFSEETETQIEGCLTFPGLFFEVERPKNITVSFQSVKGQRTTIAPPSPFVCRIIQHEIDHLDGILFTDRRDKKWTETLTNVEEENPIREGMASVDPLQGQR